MLVVYGQRVESEEINPPFCVVIPMLDFGDLVAIGTKARARQLQPVTSSTRPLKPITLLSQCGGHFTHSLGSSHDKFVAKLPATTWNNYLKSVELRCVDLCLNAWRFVLCFRVHKFI